MCDSISRFHGREQNDSMMPETAPKITIRPATAGDHEFLVALFASTRTDELQALSWDPVQAQMFINIQYNAQQQSYRLGYPSAENNIIMSDEQPVGRMLVDRTSDVIRLVDIAILSEHRNLGLGSYVISSLLDEGIKTRRPVKLSVFQTNPAIHLYERLGFQITGTESLYLDMSRFPPEDTTS
ncbi:MAG TPA: N-acetyltransferase [Pyrinomonadaceae bacterium]|jgi:ribosomal protein S18 acetylase RimI-like enzyme|nr:N-acetyltransferase [Pyrinomonadaceae bacterium]